jgi:high affinity Mn2+ porin
MKMNDVTSKLGSIMFAALILTIASMTSTLAEPAIDTSSNDGGADNWNWHAQNTDIYQATLPFVAKYSGPHSLNNVGETQETVSVDLDVGVRPWSGAEFHVDGLMWQGFGLSRTFGVVAFPNGEAYKAGTEAPNLMFSRLFVRQTIGLGGEQEDVPDGPLTLAGSQDISRLTFTFGRMSFLDVFDHNTYAGDPRTQFMNWALMANLTWDYGQDTIGYGTGATVELNQPNWTLRYGFFQMPAYVNTGNVGSGNGGEDQILAWPARGKYAPLFKSWSMATELEGRYGVNAHPGAIRFLAWADEADDDTYQEAATILRANGSLGIQVKGGYWNRPNDTVGLGGVVSGISSDNQKFLAAGGFGIEDGDGALTYGRESVVETYYDAELWKGIHGTLDYQYIQNPAFNRDRGRVSVFGGRIHAEF